MSPASSQICDLIASLERIDRQKGGGAHRHTQRTRRRSEVELTGQPEGFGEHRNGGRELAVGSWKEVGCWRTQDRRKRLAEEIRDLSKEGRSQLYCAPQIDWTQSESGGLPMQPPCVLCMAASLPLEVIFLHATSRRGRSITRTSGVIIRRWLPAIHLLPTASATNALATLTHTKRKREEKGEKGEVGGSSRTQMV